MNQPEYSQITETAGLQATAEQLERIYHRYHFAKQYCLAKDVVEVACGSGMGLGYLASSAKSVIGGDIDDANLAIANQKLKNNSAIRIEKMDAHRVLLPDNSCDVVLLYEAIYYLNEPEKFINESFRILRNGGTLIICSVNKDWKDFHPSPFTHRYFSVSELVEMVKEKFMDVKAFGAFKVTGGIKASLFSFVKRLAVKLDLIPGSLKLRAYLKRIFIGKTFPLRDEIVQGMTAYISPDILNVANKSSGYKIFYIVGSK